MNKKKCLIFLLEDICVDARVERQIEVLKIEYEVTLLAFSNQSYVNSSIDFIDLGQVRTLFSAYKNILKIPFQYRDFEVVVGNNIFSIIPVLFYKLFNPSSKIVYDSHELIVPDPDTGRSIASRKSRFLERIVCNFSAKVICPNVERSKLMRDYYGLVSLPDVIPNFVYRKKKNKFASEKFHDGAVTCIYQGVLKKGRYLDTIIRSFKYIDNCKLVIVGFGPEEDKLKSIVTQEKLSNKVSFLGRRNHEELIELAKKADIGLVTYDFSNANNKYCASNKISEYILAGLPIISTPQKSIISDIDKYNIGAFFSLSDLENGKLENIAQTIYATCKNLECYRNNISKCSAHFEFDSSKYSKLFNSL